MFVSRRTLLQAGAALAGTGLVRRYSAAATEPAGWGQVNSILSRIKPPQFPGRDFDITRYGAVADGAKDCTSAIAQAIVACNAAGGGRVVVPTGVYLTGPIHLKSNVNLHVSEGATLRFV